MQTECQPAPPFTLHLSPGGTQAYIRGRFLQYFLRRFCDPGRSLPAMSGEAALDLKKFIRDIPDFPKPGILFRDITPLLGAPAAFQEIIRRLAAPYRGEKLDP